MHLSRLLLLRILAPLGSAQHRLPVVAGVEPFRVLPAHLRSLELAVDQLPDPPAELMRPQLADGDVLRCPPALAERKEIAALDWRAVPVRAQRNVR